MKFYYVYILQSCKKDFAYVGYSENLKARFQTHNSRKVNSTKPYAPLDLIHYEAYRSMKDAKRREKYLKTSRGRTTIRTMLEEFLQSDNI